jgi:hypothetical protein
LLLCFLSWCSPHRRSLPPRIITITAITTTAGPKPGWINAHRKSTISPLAEN